MTMQIGVTAIGQRYNWSTGNWSTGNWSTRNWSIGSIGLRTIGQLTIGQLEKIFKNFKIFTVLVIQISSHSFQNVKV